jgi:acyl carrier protein
MTTTFDTIAEVISETAEIPREKITPEAHAIDDLGIDSLDFLDIVFELDKKFGIKIPLATWTQEVNEGRAAVDDYFVLKNLSARVDALIAAKSSA